MRSAEPLMHQWSQRSLKQYWHLCSYIAAFCFFFLAPFFCKVSVLDCCAGQSPGNEMTVLLVSLQATSRGGGPNPSHGWFTRHSMGITNFVFWRPRNTGKRGAPFRLWHSAAETFCRWKSLGDWKTAAMNTQRWYEYTYTADFCSFIFES